jgi:hypothetical protein
VRPLNVLIACECTGRVRDAWRDAGHNAWSCDILGPDSEPEGFTRAQWAATWTCQRWPNYHLEGDALTFIDAAPFGAWDLLIAHPPCTYLANSGVQWLWDVPPSTDGNKYPTISNGQPNAERWGKLQLGALFLANVWQSGKRKIPHGAIENPIMHKYAKHALRAYRTVLPKPQIVQPWMFGDPETKATCLWSWGLPPLIATHTKPKVLKARVHKQPPGKARWYYRSITPLGFATATLQWEKACLT